MWNTEQVKLADNKQQRFINIALHVVKQKNVHVTELPYRRQYPENCHTHEKISPTPFLEAIVIAEKILFPCVIEYSLIVAAIVYVMWQNIGYGSRIVAIYATKSKKTHYRVDCRSATKGLFLGVLLLVCTLAELIVFFNISGSASPGELEIIVSDAFLFALYFVAFIAATIALIQMRVLPFQQHLEEELDTMLLFIAQFGVFTYAIFSIIATKMNFSSASNALLFVRNLATLLQTCVQTMLILDGTRRYSRERQHRMPGRQLITFLVMMNLSLWLLNTFEVLKVEANPVQEQFYGRLSWTIITHICTPLMIFYRFHSTVCLSEVWKRAYKPKKDWEANIFYSYRNLVAWTLIPFYLIFIAVRCYVVCIIF